MCSYHSKSLFPLSTECFKVTRSKCWYSTPIVHMTIENRWSVHIVASGHHWRIGTSVPILLLLLSSYTGKWLTIKPVPANDASWVNGSSEEVTILFYMDIKLDVIFAVILSLYECYKSDIVTLYLFSGILK